MRAALVSLAAALLACLVLASCAGLIGPRQVELPLTRLQQGLDQRFPVDRRVLDIFNMELSHPQLSLMADSGRIGLSLQASIAPPFTRQTWHGSVALSGRLTLDAAGSAVRIGEMHVDRFSLDGVDPARERQLGQAADLLVERLVRDLPLYHFHPEDMRFAGVQFAPTKIATTQSALVVTFEPVK